MRLKLPSGDSSEEMYQKCLLIRYQYMLWRAVSTSRLDDAVAPDLGRFDFPQELGVVCLWHEIYKRVEDRTNPLWAICYDYQQAMLDKTLLLLRPKTITRRFRKEGRVYSRQYPGTYSKVLVDQRRVPLYNDAGRSIGRDQMYAVKSSIAGLSNSLVVGALVLGTKEPVDLLRWLMSQQQLDPVIELLWRDAKAIPYGEELVISAKLAYASCPRVYSQLPMQWIEDKELIAYFGECDGAGYFTGVGMDGLFSTIARDLS